MTNLPYHPDTQTIENQSEQDELEQKMGTTTADASTVKRLTAIERETILTMNDGEPTIRIETSQRRILTALRKKPTVFREVETGYFGATEWARFEVNADEASFNLASAGRERRQLTDEQRAELSRRARRLHNAHNQD
ncbi:hypothetical protein [Trueperella bernardiae]|uniref:hypothetical protein n=1 Tax=Trueperella bernardiae TaxID=59561 RepID=UPI0011AE87DD|nr:hypothetical protein [Trueperella bernardiae]